MGFGIALWHFLLDFLPWLPNIAAMVLAVLSLIALLALYPARRPCGHAKVLNRRWYWLTPIDRRCPICGDEL